MYAVIINPKSLTGDPAAETKASFGSVVLVYKLKESVPHSRTGPVLTDTLNHACHARKAKPQEACPQRRDDIKSCSEAATSLLHRDPA